MVNGIVNGMSFMFKVFFFFLTGDFHGIVGCSMGYEYKTRYLVMGS